MIAVALLAAAGEPPAFGTPEFKKQIIEAYHTDRPIVLKLLEAARTGNDREFQKYVAPGATYTNEGSAPTPFTVSSIAVLANQCASNDSQGVQLIDGGVQVKVFWKCAGERSVMTRLNIVHHEVIRADTSPDEVTVGPVPSPANSERGAH